MIADTEQALAPRVAGAGADDGYGPPDCVTDARGVATVRLNRPGHHNRLEPADIDALDSILATLEATRGIRLVILAARGKTFCAGYDLSDLGAARPDPGSPAGIDRLADMIDRLERLSPLTLAVLNGPAHGGGTDLALACDFRLGLPSCGMTMPAGRFGLHYYHGGMRRYVERLGLGAAKRLFLLGETLDAEAMRRVGYLDEILPDPAALEARVRTLADTVLAAADPAVLASMKACLNAIAAGEPDAARADAGWAATRRSPDVAAAVATARAAAKRDRTASAPSS